MHDQAAHPRTRWRFWPPAIRHAACSTSSMGVSARLRDRVLGRARAPLDPYVCYQVSLVACLAWVGLGADGLSSSCYGPEEAYRALATHHFLALILAGLMALTVFVISASYSQIIELFPSGGGGYLVATQLLGSAAGLVSGCALGIDFVLTIAVSLASGAEP